MFPTPPRCLKMGTGCVVFSIRAKHRASQFKLPREEWKKRMEANISVVAQNANNEDLVSINAALKVSALNAAVDVKGVMCGLIHKMLFSEDIMGTFNLQRYDVSKIADCEIVNDEEIRVDICTEKNDMIKHSATLGPRPNDVPHDNSIHLNIHVQFE